MIVCGACGSTTDVRRLATANRLFRCRECRDIIRGMCVWPYADDGPELDAYERPWLKWMPVEWRVE